MKANRLSDRIFHVYANDRRKSLFENMWPLPSGVAYNCYLINDEKTALLDTVELGSVDDFLGVVKDSLGGKTLDYLIINHMEPDHSGEIGNVLKAYPDVTVVGNKFTKKILNHYYGEGFSFLEVKDGDKLALGYHCLQFVFTPMVHWPESMMAYDQTEHILFAQDAFGSFGTLDGNVFDDEIDLSVYEREMRRYYANIVGRYSQHVGKALGKLVDKSISMICPLHGVIWRKNVAHAVSLYDRWSRCEADESVMIVYASMYHNTEAIADYIAYQLSQLGVKNIRVFDVSKTHVSYLLSEAWRCKSIVLGSCAYNAGMHPMMELFCQELKHSGLKNRQLALFGSYSWGGGGLKALKEHCSTLGWEESGAALEIQGKPNAEKLQVFDSFVQSIYSTLKQ